jgi:hypothetical protein
MVDDDETRGSVGRRTTDAGLDLGNVSGGVRHRNRKELIAALVRSGVARRCRRKRIGRFRRRASSGAEREREGDTRSLQTKHAQG